MHWSGKIVFKSQKLLSFLLDNDLSPDIATALRLFDFDVIHMKDIPEFQNRPEGVDDPELYSYCKDDNKVFITHDYSARKQHEADMKAARIYVIWIRGKTEESDGESATWRFFKILVRSIDTIRQKILSSHGAIHFRISQKTGSSPIIAWAESPYDKPRSPK